MSGLWTPGGNGPPNPPPGDGGPGSGSPDEAAPTAEEIAKIRELHAQLAATPVADVIVNHAIGIWQLSLVHLGVVTPPDEQGRAPAADLGSAGLAIDALAALVDGLQDRLGDGEAMLREALGQAQMLYVQVAETLQAP
jgi:hypothetical protein